ncbi:hypothetical protein KY331_04880 [Candidatus Woesearchaeota archaeon]|nr:hypothetical protein [Candidatus Woesearchaeota archaeon]
MKNLTSNTKPEQAFKLANGKTIKNILELKGALKNINKEVFNCHVNPNKNDFYSWIRDIYEDKILAESIKNAKHPKHIINLIEKRFGDINKEKQKEVKEIIDAIEKVKNGPIKKPIKLEQKPKIKEKKPVKLEKPKTVVKKPEVKMTKETTREKIIKKLKIKFKPQQKKKLNVKKLNLIPVCKLDREDMINKIKKGYENE